jgi:hypothetical protein
MTGQTTAAPATTAGAAPAALNPAQARVWARLNAPQPAREPLDADWLEMERRAEQHARLDGDH